MNKTTHYQLNQWDPEDRIMRSDFNADNAAIEEALYENAQAAAEARQTALDAVTAEETARKDAVSSEAETRASQDAAIRAELSTAVAEAKNEAASANAASPVQSAKIVAETDCSFPVRMSRTMMRMMRPFFVSAEVARCDASTVRFFSARNQRSHAAESGL